MEQTATVIEIEARVRAVIGFDRFGRYGSKGTLIEPRIIVSPLPLEIK
jgi:hypothetical protein